MLIDDHKLTFAKRTTASVPNPAADETVYREDTTGRWMWKKPDGTTGFVEPATKGTLHDLGQAAAIAVKDADHGKLLHCEGGAGYSFDSANLKDGDVFHIVNKSGAVVASALSFTGFNTVFDLLDQGKVVTAAYPLQPEECRVIRITENGGNWFANISEGVQVFRGDHTTIAAPTTPALLYEPVAGAILRDRIVITVIDAGTVDSTIGIPALQSDGVTGFYSSAADWSGVSVSSGVVVSAGNGVSGDWTIPAADLQPGAVLTLLFPAGDDIPFLWPAPSTGDANYSIDTVLVDTASGIETPFTGNAFTGWSRPASVPSGGATDFNLYGAFDGAWVLLKKGSALDFAVQADVTAGTAKKIVDAKLLKENLPSKGTLHDLGQAAAIAVTDAHHGYELHVEGGAGYSLDSAALKDGDEFVLANTSGAVQAGALKFSNFIGAFLRDGTTDTTLTSPFDIGIAKAYLVRITDNGGNFFLNLYPTGGGAASTPEVYVQTAAPAVPTAPAIWVQPQDAVVDQVYYLMIQGYDGNQTYNWTLEATDAVSGAILTNAELATIDFASADIGAQGDSASIIGNVFTIPAQTPVTGFILAKFPNPLRISKLGLNPIVGLPNDNATPLTFIIGAISTATGAFTLLDQQTTADNNYTSAAYTATVSGGKPKGYGNVAGAWTEFTSTPVTYANFTTASNGLVPAPGAATGVDRVLLDSGIWADYRLFAAAAHGLVPAPGAATGVDRVLLDSGVWADYQPFAATANGLVPAPGAANGNFLKDDGTWDAVVLSADKAAQTDIDNATADQWVDAKLFRENLNVPAHSIAFADANGRVIGNGNLVFNSDTARFLATLDGGGANTTTLQGAEIGFDVSVKDTGSGSTVSVLGVNSLGFACTSRNTAGEDISILSLSNTSNVFQKRDTAANGDFSVIQMDDGTLSVYRQKNGGGLRSTEITLKNTRIDIVAWDNSGTIDTRLTVTDGHISVNVGPTNDEDVVHKKYVDNALIARLIRNTNLVGAIDGVNTAFTLQNATIVPNSQAIYKDGLRMAPAVDYTMTGNAITFVVAPPNGAVLLADYEVA